MRKKLISAIALLCFALVLAACAADATGQPKNQTLTLNILKDEYRAENASLAYTITNRVAETALVELIPVLEIQSGDEWIIVESNAGFCGTPDSIEKSYLGSLPFSFYDGLEPGTYRLSFSRLDPNTWAACETVSDTFVLLDAYFAGDNT